MRKIAIGCALALVFFVALLVVIQPFGWNGVGGRWVTRSRAFFAESASRQTELCRLRFGVFPICSDTVGRVAYLGEDCVAYETNNGASDLLRVRCGDRHAVDVPLRDIARWKLTSNGATTEPEVQIVRGRVSESQHVVNAATLKRVATGKETRVVPETATRFIEPNVPIGTTGRTPLAQAVMDGNRALVSDLLAAGADANARDAAGSTVLSYAVDSRDRALVESLLKKGANPNSRDRSGVTPLLRAVMNRDVEIIRLLIDNGADANVADNHGDSPVGFARRAGWRDVLDALRTAPPRRSQ